MAIRSLFPALLTAAAVTLLAACDTPPDLRPAGVRDAPFVPSDQNVVEAMLALADTGPEDIVYDLGSGDGRIPITAVEKFNVRLAVGIEIDPRLVRQSEERAREAAVDDRVRFIEGDIFRVDFSEATVVTLFLMNEMNEALRPLLLKDLRPGTRIVAHMFSMGDWPPDREIAVRDRNPAGLRLMETDENPVYLWTVPAEAAGSWRWATGPGTRFSLDLRQKFQLVSGEIDIGRGSVPIREGRLTGERLRFEVFDREKGRDIVVRFDGWIDGPSMRGTVTLDGRSVPFTAERGP